MCVCVCVCVCENGKVDKCKQTTDSNKYFLFGFRFSQFFIYFSHLVGFIHIWP